MTFWSLTNSDFPTYQTFHQFHDLYTELASTDFEWFPWSICNGCDIPAGNAYPSGHLVPSPIVGLACAPIVETRFIELAMSLLDFSPLIPLGNFSILLCILLHFTFILCDCFYRTFFKASAHSFKQFTPRLLKLSFSLSLSMHLYNSDGRHAWFHLHGTSRSDRSVSEATKYKMENSLSTVGLEPSTLRFQDWCSTYWASRAWWMLSV